MAKTAALLRAVGMSILMLAWLHFVFLHPLKEEAFEMQERQLDPTQIVAIPYDLGRLAIYVTFTVLILLVLPLLSSSSSAATTWKRIQTLVYLTVATFCVFLLCGASPVERLQHTWLASLYLAALAWLDPPVFYEPSSALPNSVRERVSTMSLLERIRGNGEVVKQQEPHSSDESNKVAICILHATVAATIPAPVLLLYDNGWQAQRWPIPVVLGSTIGWIIGLLFGAYWACFFAVPASKKTFSVDNKNLRNE